MNSMQPQLIDHVDVDAQGGSKSQVSSSVSEVAANRGANMPDVKAVGEGIGSIAEWQKRHNIDTEKHIRLVKLAHMRYQHPDLSTITTFLLDFGMHLVKSSDEEIWFRGYGPDQYVYYACKGPQKFLGGAFEVEGFGDLEKASKLPGASRIESLSNAPGGGHMVTVWDPEGFPVNLIYGQEPAEVGKLPEKLITNFETEKRRVREFLRFTPGPAAVHKLGHFGLCVQNFESQMTFYTRTFNLVPSDLLYVDQEDEKLDVAIFAHIDRGAVNVDHHTFFMSSNATSHVHHCSFEVHDFDTQNLGHQWLAKKEYKSVWGVGRHILGSQLFDYWWDTTGFMVEHYADGDLVNEKTPIGYGPAGDEALAVWGPEVPATFLD